MDYSNYKTKTNLILPFNGTWIVGNGGRNPEKNNHLNADGTGPQDQTFAYDFIKSHKDNGRNLEDYEAFGSEVIAPAGGVVCNVINNCIDVAIGERDEEVITGNRIVINHGNGEWSVLCHFKYNSILVKEGDVVKQGDVLGLCGNTGNTSEPHIHYHLQDDAVIMKANGLPAQFAKILIDGEEKENIEPDGDQKVSNL